MNGRLAAYPLLVFLLSLSIRTSGMVPAARAAPATSSWTATATLYRSVHGKWVQTSTADVLDNLRGVLVLRSSGAEPAGVSALMEIHHVTWQGWHLVEMPPTVSVRMHRLAPDRASMTYAASVRLPVLLPLEYSRVRFLVSGKGLHIQVTKVLRVDAQLGSSAGVPVLAVPQAIAFCRRRPRLRGLPYGVDVKGYVVRDDDWGGAGPVPGVILDRPARVHWAFPRPTAENAHVIPFYALGGPQSGQWTTLRGALGCDRGTAMAYAIDGI